MIFSPPIPQQIKHAAWWVGILGVFVLLAVLT
jgi:hypothetical protein